MVAAYLRRKKWEYRGQAVAIVTALGEAMGGDSKSGSGRAYKEISTEAMLQEIAK